MLYALENMYMRRKINDSEYFNNLAAVIVIPDLLTPGIKDKT